MALGGVNVGWNESVPSGTSAAGTADDEFKSIKTGVRSGLDSEHHWSSTGGAGTGAHRLGSARAFYAAASAVSVSDADGRLFLTSDTSRLYHVSSATTTPLGTQYVVEGGPALRFQGSNVTSTATQWWCAEAGTGHMTTSSATTQVNLGNTYVRGTVTLTQTITALGASIAGPLADRPVLFASSLAAGATSFIVQNLTGASAQASSTTSYDFQWQVVGIKAG